MDVRAWDYRQPTEIIFGRGGRAQLPELLERFNGPAVLVTDSSLADLPFIEELSGLSGRPTLFAQVEPNPTVDMVDALAELLRVLEVRVVIAVGGGSSLDCAKAACSVALQGGSARRYHSEGARLDARHVPLIAMPTTAGTGSEVTPMAVLNDPEKRLKAPLAHDNFFPTIALVDPELTYSMPRPITASTGFDALAHAIEGYWSRNHQPICDLFALEGVRLVLTNLPRVLADGEDAEAREGMALAALLGGLALHAPKSAAAHICSLPLSATWHLPHGMVCALTLDHFIRFNGPAMGERGVRLAQAVGCAGMDELADRVAALKADSGLPTRLSEVGVTEAEIEALVADSLPTLMGNHPREVTAEDLAAIYRQIL